MSTPTRTYEDVLAATSMAYNRKLDPVVLEYAMNTAITKMWNSYSWRGTEAALPPFWLVPREQDYGLPFYAVPSDFSRIVEAAVVHLSSNEPLRYQPLKVVSNLQLTNEVGFPDCIAFKPDTEGFRIYPAADLSMTTPNWLIEGIYKKRAPKVARSGMGGNLILWDDQYFDTFCEAFKWAATKYGGNIQELAIREAAFMNSLAEATAQENLEQGDPQIWPSEALGASFNGGWGVSSPLR